MFEPGEEEIYASIYEYEHSGWVPGYQSFAKYHEDIDAVVVEFYSTTDPKLYNWNLSEIINNRIVKNNLDFIKNSQNAKVFQQYLIKFPDGIFAGLAMGLKYTSFVTPLVIVGLIIWVSYRQSLPVGSRKRYRWP